MKLVLAAFRWKDEITGRQGSKLSKHNSSKLGHLRRNSQKRKAGKTHRSFALRKDQTIYRSTENMGSVGEQHNSLQATDGQYAESLVSYEVGDTKFDLDNISESYQKNWEDLASAQQLEILIKEEKQSKMQPVTSYTSNQNEGNEIDTTYACSIKSFLSTTDERNHNLPPRSPRSATERFVNLTLTANNNRNENRRVFSDVSSQYDPESESGIEVAEREDPCDSLMKKIRAVSTSRLPNDLKLKYVSELISCSLTSQRRYRPPSTVETSVSDYEGYRRRYPTKGKRRQSNTFSNVSSVSHNFTHSVDNLSRLDSDVLSVSRMRGSSLCDVSNSSLLDVSSYSNVRLPRPQFDKSLKCSFRPEDISLVLEDTSGDVTNSGSLHQSPRGLGSLTQRSGFTDRRALSLDDLLEESFSLSQSSWNIGDLDAASSCMDVIDWSAVEDKDSVSSLNLQADLNRLRQCQDNR